MRVLIASLLVALVLAAAVQADINVNLLTHNILKREATCNQECVAMYNNLGKCTEVCAQIVTGNEGIADILEKIQKDQEAAEASTTNTLSDKSAEEVQEEANTQLYELFHTALKELLTSGTYGAGFQIMDPAIELTDITAQVPGWEQRPISDIERQIVEDYDNPAILGEELIQVSTPGPRRDTNGVRFIDEYRSYLSGVQGVSGLAIPNPYTLPSAQRTIDYQNALNTCSERYMNAAYFILARFDIDSYVTTFCREVKAAEDEMLKQIGIEQYQAGNNPVYGAAVALGMAQSLYSASNAYKKFHSFKALEYECIKAREEGRPIQGISKSLSFNYNYHTWKNTQQTLSWKTKKRSFIFKKTVHHTQTINTNFDATSLGGVEIAFADFRNVPVYPGTWFSRSAFRDTRYKPREGHSPISRFFSDQGTLTLMPKSLYVAVNPKIAFWVDNAKKEDFKQTSQTVVTGGFSVFGFGIKSAKNHQINVEEGETQNGKTKITITSTTCKPQLFAIEHHYTY